MAGQVGAVAAARTAAAARGVGCTGDDSEKGEDAVKSHKVPAYSAAWTFLVLFFSVIAAEQSTEYILSMSCFIIALLLIAIYLKMPEPDDE